MSDKENGSSLRGIHPCYPLIFGSRGGDSSLASLLVNVARLIFKNVYIFIITPYIQSDQIAIKLRLITLKIGGKLYHSSRKRAILILSDFLKRNTTSSFGDTRNFSGLLFRIDKKVVLGFKRKVSHDFRI